MNQILITRRHLIALAVLSGTATMALAAPLADAARSAMLTFDGLYIPVLFLTGSAGKSAEGAAKATAAMRRVMEQWPARRQALEAGLPGQAVWAKALDGVQDKLREADVLVSKAQWAASHEVLEHVREIMFEARRSLGLAYALDDFTAFHGAMEKVANATSAQRPTVEADLAAAKAMWKVIEGMTFDPAVYGLSAAQASQLAQARADETAALARLSQALREAGDADLRKAMGAIKPPFVRAYLAFGAPV